MVYAINVLRENHFRAIQCISMLSHTAPLTPSDSNRCQCPLGLHKVNNDQKVFIVQIQSYTVLGALKLVSVTI